MKVKSLSHSQLLATPWTAAYQAPLSMDCPDKSTGVGCHCLLRQLWQAGLYASCHMGSSQTRDQTHVSCIGPLKRTGHLSGSSQANLGTGLLNSQQFCRRITIMKALHVMSEKAMAPRSSTLAWKIPWMEEPGRLQSMGSLRVRHN